MAASKKDDTLERDAVKPQKGGGINEETGAVEDPKPIAEADKTSYPVPNDAGLDEPPLRSPRAPVDLAASLATGAGAHNPPDPEKFEWDGRPKQQ